MSLVGTGGDPSTEEVEDYWRKENRRVYDAQIGALRKTHVGEWVAVRGGEVFVGKIAQEAIRLAEAKHPTATQGILEQITAEEPPVKVWTMHTPFRP